LAAARVTETPGTGGEIMESRQLWTGRLLSGLAVLFLAFDTVMKLLLVPDAVKGTADLGYPTSALFGIGVLELICLVAYLIPRTAVLGAVLFTGYLGGAIATHVRMENPLFTHVLFPVYVAAFIWGGLYLRNRKLRAVLPLGGS
jgi:DoxX-like family